MRLCRQVYLNKIRQQARTVIERDREDFWQHYDLRIIYALENWDPSRGAQFTTYLYAAVRGTLNVYLRTDYKSLYPKRYQKYGNEPVQIVHLDDMDLSFDQIRDSIQDPNWDHCKINVTGDNCGL